jgi:Dynamin family
MTVPSLAPAQRFPHAVVQRVIDQLGALGARLREHAPEVGQRIQLVARAIEQEQVTVNFGGVFKAGKSTMINAALGRAILPVDDVPETGAVCCLLAGAEDGAIVVEGATRRQIPCTTEAIRSQITLLSERGERRSEVAAIERAEITLRECIIPRDACWVDSPGYNDTAEMDERTRRSAGCSDVLVWVLTSRQLLSQVEMTFLTEHLRHSGPASVVFVLNGFLRRDSAEEWEQFLDRSAPQLLDKVRHFAPDMGFLPEAGAQIIPVAGRAMCKHGPDTFGGAELKRFLLGVDSRFAPRVMRTRLWRAGAELKRCVQQLDELLASQKADLNRRRSEWAAVRQIGERKRQLTATLAQGIDLFLEEFSRDTRACAAAISARLTDIVAASGGVYARHLNQGIADAARTALTQLNRRVATAVKRFGEAPLSEEWTKYLDSLAQPPETTVHFPERLEAGGIDALIVATPAFFGEKLGRPPAWLAAAREAIDRSTAGVVAAMQARRTHFCEAFERLYSLRVSDPPAPDDSALALLGDVRDRLGGCAAEAATLATSRFPEPTGDTEALVRGWQQGFAG